MDNKKIRKLSHLSGEDYYYMTYLLILCLNEFSAKKSHIFNDHRKLSFLIHIISSSSVVDIINQNDESKVINAKDKDLLYTSYTKGTLHSKDIYKLLLTLEIKGFVEVLKTESPEVLNVKTHNKNIPKDFFDKNIFEKELNNISELKKSLNRLSVIGFKTFVDKVYTNKGLSVWVQ
jgi:hypothetical protein